MYVQQTLDEFRKQGFYGENVIIMGHSLGGVMSQIYLKNNLNFKALVLLGSGILRSSRSID
jgi:pimeloyl-ACP methyl ester carboxylesterase